MEIYSEQRGSLYKDPDDAREEKVNETRAACTFLVLAIIVGFAIAGVAGALAWLVLRLLSLTPVL